MMAQAAVVCLAHQAHTSSVRLVVDGLEIGHIHELKLPGVRSAKAAPLLHPVAYYTLWNVPKE